MLRWLAGLILLLAVAGAAQAHPAPFSFLDIHLNRAGLSGSLVIHDYDAAHELRIARPEMLADRALAGRTRGPIVRLMQARLQVVGERGTLTPQWGQIEVLPERQSLRLPFTIAGPTPAALTIKARLFPYDSSHQTFVNIDEGGRLSQAILNAERPQMRFYSGTPQGRWSVVRTFVQAGVQHIMIGPDHVLFLLGLLLLGGSWWRLAAIVTAFTLGQSLTLSLAALGIVRISPAIIEPAIALSIIVVGVDALLVTRQRRSAAAASDTRDLRTWMAATFGLVHGFGFASVLIEFGLPQGALLWSLAAFNIGVEIGQLIIVIGLVALGRTVMRLPFYREHAGQKFVPFAAIAIIAAGLYWFTLRIIFAPAA